MPSEKSIQRWYQQAPAGFKYSLKVSRFITHVKKFDGAEEAIKKFYELGCMLKDKMGCFLFQLPKTFIYKEEHLQRILRSLDSNYENVIEFRHPSWWNQKVFDAFAESNVMFCSVSGLGLPEDLVILNHRAYIRFHGNTTYNISYPFEDLLLWSSRIKSCSFTNLWGYFNNDAHAYAPQNAQLLSQLLS